MPGLMQSAAPAPAGDAPPFQMPDTEGLGDSVDATPEEQAQYDRFINNAYSLIYDPKVLPGIVKRLQDKSDPLGAVAGTAVATVARLRDSAARKGVELSPDVLFHGGTEILEDLADLSAKVGGHKFSQQDVEGALYRALDEFREMETQRGGLDPQSVQQDFQALLMADKQGALGKVLPGIDAAGGKGGAGDPPADEPADEEEV